MAFKVECEKCGQIGKLINKPDSGTLGFEKGDFTLQIINTSKYSPYPSGGGYDGVELTCNRCKNKVTDIP